jgi:DNA ligase-1
MLAYPPSLGILCVKTPADVVAAIEKTSGRLDKEAIVLDAWNKGIENFFIGAQMAYDALRTYGYKKIPLIDDVHGPDDTDDFTWQQFIDLADKLEHRKLTGHAGRDALLNASNKCSIREWNGFYRRVLLKDLRCGITDGTINRVLEKVGEAAKPYLVPVFSCQLAKNGDDHPKKMIGPKLIDPKLDGVRLLTILDKERNTVGQYSRDGRMNENFPTLTTGLEKLLPHIKFSLVLDGEVVSRNFQALMKQLNKKEADTKDANLALFDCLPLKDFLKGECKLTQTQRHEALVQFIPLLQTHCGTNVFVIPKLSVNLSTPEGQKTFSDFNKETVEAGYEGVMVKDPEAIYRTKRSDAWLKIKPNFTVDLEVIGFEAGTKGTKFEKTLGNLVCRGTDNGKLIETSVGSGFSDELRDEIWNNRESVLGRIVEVKTDVITKAQKGDSWSLRFPVFMQFRGWEPGQKI